jgi:4-hydroxyacetophenone monooxygenase
MTDLFDLSPLPADDDQIRRALADAELMALLAACAHITGDLGVLDPDLRPDAVRLREPQVGYTPDQQARARQIILDALVRFRDGQGGVPARLSDEQLHTIMNFCAGVDVSDRYVPLCAEELAVDGDLRAPQWSKADLDPGRELHVLVIGAGMSGIAAAHRLQQAGVPVTVFEKNADVGGTWLENSYPGCRVDVQNHMYSYSFAQKIDWPFYHSPRPVLHEYFRDCAERFDVLPLVRFGTEVTRCVWDEATQSWTVTAKGPDGVAFDTVAQVVVSAVGQLNRPKMPDIAGIDDFAGPSFHSARWDHDVDLVGKRVAIVGTGASACQFIPIVAEQAAHLDVFQRTAPWMIPSDRYHQPVAEGFQWLLGRVPFYAQWYRFFMFWRGAEGMLPAATVDPSYPPTERAVSAANEQFRELLLVWLHALTEGDEELRAKITPNYPPLSKRFVVDDGTWVRALRRPDVDLHTGRIERIEANGVRTADGELHEADVIVYGTGFQASRFLTPMAVTGRDGVDLHEQWAGDARAYLGVVVPNFPNFFVLYGPNTNIVVNGSIIYFSECEVHYLTRAVHLMLSQHIASLDPRRDVHDAYNERIDEANQLRTWGFSNVSAWYKNEYGRTAQNWPYTVLEYWEQTREVDPDDYHVVSLDRA